MRAFHGILCKGTWLVNIHSVSTTPRWSHSPEYLHSVDILRKKSVPSSTHSWMSPWWSLDHRKSLEVNGDSALEVCVITTRPCKRCGDASLNISNGLSWPTELSSVWISGVLTENSTPSWVLLATNLTLYLSEICSCSFRPLFLVLLNLFWVGVLVPGWIECSKCAVHLKILPQPLLFFAVSTVSAFSHNLPILHLMFQHLCWISDSNQGEHRVPRPKWVFLFCVHVKLKKYRPAYPWEKTLIYFFI